jgi:hypothetical protein
MQVSAVLEEASRVPSTDLIEGATHRFHQSFPSARLSLARDVLDLGEGFLDGVVVG